LSDLHSCVAMNADSSSRSNSIAVANSTVRIVCTSVAWNSPSPPSLTIYQYTYSVGLSIITCLLKPRGDIGKFFYYLLPIIYYLEDQDNCMCVGVRDAMSDPEITKNFPCISPGLRIWRMALSSAFPHIYF